MTQMPGGNSTIRITPEELASEHVDDLLKRQASLRGEGGITRSSKGKWYYQNWFIFTIVGMLAAIGAVGHHRALFRRHAVYPRPP